MREHTCAEIKGNVVAVFDPTGLVNASSVTDLSTTGNAGTSVMSASGGEGGG